MKNLLLYAAAIASLVGTTVHAQQYDPRPGNLLRQMADLPPRKMYTALYVMQHYTFSFTYRDGTPANISSLSMFQKTVIRDYLYQCDEAALVNLREGRTRTPEQGVNDKATCIQRQTDWHGFNNLKILVTRH